MNLQAEKYLETFKRSKRTKGTYAYELQNYFDLVGDVVSHDAYKTFIESLAGYSISSQHIKVSAVKGYYDFVDAWAPAMDKLNKLYLEQTQTDDVTFNRAEIEKLITHCEKLRGDLRALRDRTFVLMAVDSGLRISELCSLKRVNIEWLDRRAIVVRKRGKKKLVRLSDRSLEALKLYLDTRAKLDGATGKPLNSLPIFAQHGKNRKMKPMSVNGMWKAVKSRIAEAGVNPELVRIHDLRHYFVTMAVIAKGLKVGKELADHESMATTNRYAHYADTELDIAYDEIFNRRIK